MARHDRRIRRLAQQVKGRHATAWQARLQRMSYEDLLAEVVRGARHLGMPGEWALADPEAAVVWLDVQMRKVSDALPGAEQNEVPTV